MKKSIYRIEVMFEYSTMISYLANDDENDDVESVFCFPIEYSLFNFRHCWRKAIHR